MTAELMRKAMDKHGDEKGFIGHEGGDDFMMILSCKTLGPVTDYFLKEFGKQSKTLYSKEDQERGYILGKERRLEGTGEPNKSQEVKKFPLLAISLAALSNEEHPFQSYDDITEKMAKLKKQAKSKKGNSLVVVKV